MSIFAGILSALTNAAAGSGAVLARTAASTAPPAAPLAAIDVEAVLTKRAAEQKEDLDWRRSIVDLMKLLQLDSSLAARKQLAQELGYTGDKSDSAAMNAWLHGKVMQKLAENGGKVSASLMKH
jgi:hypothetical protein